MEKLYVLYDAECGLCTWAKRWLMRQPALINLSFIPAGSVLAQRLFPGLSRPGSFRKSSWSSATRGAFTERGMPGSCACSRSMNIATGPTAWHTLCSGRSPARHSRCCLANARGSRAG